MKVCHITTVHPAKDTRIFYKECKSLAKAGFEVNLLVINSESFLEDDVNVIGLSCDFNNRLGRFRKASKVIYNKALELNADIYHFHDPELLVMASKLIKKGKKVIYDVHEDLPRQLLSKHYIPKPIRKPIANLVEYFENKYATKMTGIITATDFIKDRYLKFHEEVAAIKNYPILSAETKFLRPFEEKQKEIVYVGSITKERGLSELVKAMDLLGSEISLNLAGTYAPKDYRDELIKTQGWEKVNEIGFANREKVKELFDRSFAGLVTLHPIINYLDALPVKMFEYMASGVPVIASNFPLWKAIVEGENCGICVNPLDPKSIAEAIEWIYNHPKEAEEMGQNGFKAVTEIYNWSIEEQKLIDFYNKIAD